MCAAPSKSFDHSIIIMYVWQCPHDVDVHILFCFDLYIQLTCSQGHVFMDFLDRSSLRGRALPEISATH